ncbi:GTPase [Minwuia sp.]|uniref:flagellar biosynthesis protein FlhF n=1 Tax=Minwuia sp. TaxID=2493630 RepID=UPI003A8F2EB1
MLVRTFIAPSMARALSEVRRELGADAVILGSTQVPEGVEVTAAVEPPEEITIAAPEPAIPEEAAFLVKAVAFHGAPVGLNERICRTAAASGHDDLVTALTAGIDEAFRFRPLAPAREQALALVGPPGAGKTVVAAKYALEAALSGTPLRIATTDIERPGGDTRLKELAAIIENPPVRLSPERRFSGGGNRLIDTEGVNPFDAYDMARLTETIRINEAEPVLVLPAGGDPFEYEDIAAAFQAIGVRRIIATRLDTARRIGGLLAAAGNGLSFCMAGASPVIADGLHELTPAALARLILSDPDADKALNRDRKSA